MELTPESMGYDRAIVVFSPDGRLFQVEYAREAVKKGSTVVALKYKDGVLFGAKKKKSNIITSTEKIFKVDHFVGIASSGFVADTRVLVDAARVKAQQHRLLYDEPVSIIGVSKYLADRIQAYTQYAGVRPYGVSLLIGGIDNTGKHIYQTDPSGVLLECNARAVGKEEDKANELLEKEWKENLDLKEAADLAIKVIKLEGKGKHDELILRVIDDKGFRELSKEEMKKLGVSL
ncbi:MAG: archaeal proteasome endopeptidase complex subunit alpha [Candidatus Nanohaloarchaeota archaeon]|nr:archaeal proteasome endopeptidase complex subunit alpha [Candidatus Nanohaloarchaeota archaeon]